MTQRLFCLALVTPALITALMPIGPAACQETNSADTHRSTPVHVERVHVERVHVDLGDQGMVVCDSAPASRIGRDILRQGGSAVDAAVATALALAVSWPDAGNIGGGGFMLVRPADGQHPVCVDYREKAPQSMHAQSFSREDTTFSHKAVGVPGTVRGLATAHERFGRLPWRDLVIPAARLAADGVPIDEPLADSLNSVLAETRVLENARFAELRRVYGRADGKPWQVGDRLLLPDLAKTLTMIADQGPDAFYNGPLATALVAEMQRGDGQISMSDLANYRSEFREVIRGEYRGYTILGAPPPSSGGICLVESLNILENFDLGSRDRYDPITIHLIAEAARRAFADRARFLGDPDFVPIPSHLTDKAYAKQLASGIDRDRASSSAAIAPEIKLASESPETTHFSIVDADGMAVSNTYTLEASWGSRIVVKGAGFVLNNEMGDFNWFPGETNAEGRIGTPANTIAGGKRMLSSQSPVIVERQGKLILVTGSPGGRTIINTVLCILLNVIDFKQTPADAVANARMHHQWFPDLVQLESIDQLPHAKVIAALNAMGHVTQGRAVQGSAHSIAVDPETKQLTGVADYRRGGRPASLNSQCFALWDFAEPVATTLPQTFSISETVTNWSTSIPGIETDGRDHLRVHTRGTAASSISSTNLPRSTGPWSAEIKIDAARFSGDEQNERLRFAFAQSTASHHVIASLTIGRHGDAGIWLQGQTDHDTGVGPISVSDGNLLDHPLIIKLSIDPSQQSMEIASRDASAASFTIHGTAKLNSNAHPDQFQMSVENDIADDGEFMDVDRIELRSSVLSKPLRRE